MTPFKSIAYLTSAVFAVRAASAAAVDREEFCQSDFTELESYMTNELARVMEQEFSNSFECACGDVDMNDKSFVVDCSLEGVMGGVDMVDNAFVSSERLVFELNSLGQYSLTETSWSWTDEVYEGGFPEEIFYLEDGMVTSCKSNGCKSCTLCEDNKSLAIDCSNAPEGAWMTSYECSESYTGSFSNTFDFGVIEGGEGVVIETPTEPTNVTDQEEFCKSLDGLESHIDKGFEELMGASFTSSHECTCSEVSADGTFTVDCVMEGFDGVESFVNSEQLIFGLDDGAYHLMKASWTQQDSIATTTSQELIMFDEDGTITSCEPNGCTFCAICDGKKSVAVDCINLGEGFYSADCSEDYTGAFANTFDFGVIRQSSASPGQPTGPPTSPLSSIEPVDPAASAVSKEEFCQNFSELETHLTKELDILYDVTFTNTFKCSCSDPDMTEELFGKSFLVDCSMEDTFGNKTFVNSERMVFKLVEEGEYLLSETSWSWMDSSLNWGSQEVFYFDDKFLTSCKANACEFCAVCEDKMSIAVDCDDNEGEPYSYECSDGYKGSLANNFNFKMILAAVESTNGTSTSSQGGFCQRLSELEDFMGRSFEELQEQTYTSNYECACGALDTNDNQFTVDCVMKGSDGAAQFVSSETMLFKLNQQGEYALSETSWSWQDSSLSWESQEVFTIDNGILVSCEAKGCVSCDICDDQKSIAVNCSNLEVEDYTTDCSERNSGAFANSFDFGVIRWDDVLPSVTADSLSQPTSMPSLQQPLQPSTKPVDAPVASEPVSTPPGVPTTPSQPVVDKGSTGVCRTVTLFASLASLVLSFFQAL